MVQGQGFGLRGVLILCTYLGCLKIVAWCCFLPEACLQGLIYDIQSRSTSFSAMLREHSGLGIEDLIKIDSASSELHQHSAYV